MFATAWCPPPPTRWQADCYDHSVCQEQHCIRHGHITRNQLMRHVFRWRSRSSQIASGVKGLSMSTWTDCGYPRGNWAAIGLNPRRESPSGWGPFVETVCLVPAVALTGCVGSSGRSKLGLILTGWYPTCLADCLGNAMGCCSTTCTTRVETRKPTFSYLSQLSQVINQLNDYPMSG